MAVVGRCGSVYGHGVWRGVVHVGKVLAKTEGGRAFVSNTAFYRILEKDFSLADVDDLSLEVQDEVVHIITANPFQGIARELFPDAAECEEQLSCVFRAVGTFGCTFAAEVCGPLQALRRDLFFLSSPRCHDFRTLLKEFLSSPSPSRPLFPVGFVSMRSRIRKRLNSVALFSGMTGDLEEHLCGKVPVFRDEEKQVPDVLHPPYPTVRRGGGRRACVRRACGARTSDVRACGV